MRSGQKMEAYGKRSRQLIFACTLGLLLGSSALAADSVVIGYAAPSLDGAQAQIQASFVFGVEKRGCHRRCAG